MSDPKKTANTLRQLAALIENPEAQADLAERAAFAARRRLRDGAQKLLDKFFNETPIKPKPKK